MLFRYLLRGERAPRKGIDAHGENSTVRRDVWPVGQHLAEFSRRYPDFKIVGYTGNGNILANQHLVSFVNGEFYAVEFE